MNRFIIILILLGFWGIACQSQEANTVDPEKREMPVQEGWNSTVKVTKQGRPTVIVHYGHMKKFADKKETFFEDGLKLYFYSASGDCTTVLTADSGAMNENRNDFEAIGHVLVESMDGKTLRTEKLRWEEAQQKILSDEFVTLTTADGDTLMGEGFESDQSLNFWKIAKPRGVTGKAFAIDELEKQATSDTLKQQ